MMDIKELSLLGAGVDYNEIPPIHQKRTLAFINHFIYSTVGIMNKLSKSCEMKLERFETQLQRMDACLKILEAKLDSVPGLTEAVQVQVESTTAPVINMKPETETSETQVLTEPSQDASKNSSQSPVVPSSQVDPRYARFLRMVHVGVPPQAVKLKMQQEGLDPNLLDNPSAIPTVPTPQKSSESDSDESNSSN